MSDDERRLDDIAMRRREYGRRVNDYRANIFFGFVALTLMLVESYFSGHGNWLGRFFANVGMMTVLFGSIWCAYAVQQIRRWNVQTSALAEEEYRLRSERPSDRRR